MSTESGCMWLSIAFEAAEILVRWTLPVYPHAVTLPPLNGCSWTSVLKNFTDTTTCVRLCIHLDKRCGILGCHSDIPENSFGISSTYRRFEGS